MQNTTILSLDEASKFLRQIDLKTVKDVRALDVDLLVVLTNGDRIILSGGAFQALAQPNFPLEFANGSLTLGQLFQQVDVINVSPEANMTAASKEITRYNQNNAKVKKTTDNEEEAQEQPFVATPGEQDGTVLSNASTGRGNTAEPELLAIRSADRQELISAVEINSAKEESWSTIWPAAAGLLALVASTASAKAAAVATTQGVTPSFATLAGTGVLNNIDNATVNVYSDAAELLGTASVTNGKFEVKLSRANYKGVMMLVISDDNTLPDNYTDEVSGERKDVGVIRALAVATGADQSINVTALTELAVLKAGVQSGVYSPVGVTADLVNQHNAAVANLFKIENILTSNPVSTKDLNGDPNPAFAALSPAQQNYGAALHAVSLLEHTRGESTQQVLENMANALRLSLEKGALVWNGSDLADELQGDLYSERSNDAQAQAIGGSYASVANYLEANKVAFALPSLLIKNADTTREETWQEVQAGQTLTLDRGDFTSGSLAVRGPVGSIISVRVLGKGASGQDLSPVDLGSATVDASGFAVFRVTSTATLSALSQINRTQKAQAVITISDGDNSRTNIGEWGTSTVSVDFATVPETRITSLSMIDTAYQGSAQAGDTAFGSGDTFTSNAGVSVRLTQSLRPTEKLQFSIDGGSNWIDPANVLPTSDPLVFTVTGLSQVNQSTEVRARVVLFGRNYTGGLGNANEFSGAAVYTLDTIEPNRVVFAISSGGDNGLSASDLITITAGQRINIASGLESGSNVTLRFFIEAGPGTGTLQRTRGGTVTTLSKGEWHTFAAGDQLTLLGDTVEGTGKIALTTRQIDRAGNTTSHTQTFIVDTRNVVDRAVALANASAAVTAAQEALDAVPLTNTAGRAAAARALAAAVAAEKLAIDTAVAGMLDAANGNEIRLNQLGLQDSAGESLNVTPDTLRAVINALAATKDPQAVNTKPGLAAVVEKALADAANALALATAYDGSNTAPTLADFSKMGVDGVSDSNLPMVLSALAALPADKSDTIAEVQAAVAAYNKLLALADGVSNNSTPTLPADYAALGVQPALSTGAAGLLGQVIDRKSPADIDTVAEISALADVVERIAQQAALPEGAFTTPPLSPADFEKLGIVGVIADNLQEVARAIARTADDGTGVDTLAEVRAIVDGVIADLKFIIDYAESPEGSASSPAPLLSHYRSVGLSAQQIGDGSAGSVNNLASINDAVKGLTGIEVGSLSRVAAVVDSYNAILGAADGRASNASTLPTAEDYARIGVKELNDAFPPVNGVQTPAQSSALALLNTVVDAAARSRVDTVAEVRELASIAARVVQLATGEQPTPALTVAELNKLGISPAVTEASLPLVLAGIQGSADDGSGVTTPADIAELARAAQDAQDAITQYAADAAATPPTLAQYQALGAEVKDQTAADALNSALASAKITPELVDTPAEVQALADAYAKVLNQTGDTADAQPDPSPADYSTIGADVPPTDVANDLLNSVLLGKTSADVDSLAEVNALIAAANAVTALAAADMAGLAGSLPHEQAADLQAKLALLGVKDLDPSTMAAVLAAIVASADDGSGIDTLAELQALADSAKSAQLAISDYAENNTGVPPTAEQYAAIGVSGVSADDSVLLEAVNAALASAPVTKDHADTPQEVQAIVDAYARILAAADGGANLAAVLPSATDYLAVGVSPAPAEGSPELSLLNQVVDKAQGAAVATPAALSQLADTAARLMTLAAGGEPVPPISKADLEALGVTGLTDDAMVAVLKAIEASPNDGSGIDTLSELQVLANNARTSLARIEAYAQNNSGTVPTEADYRNVGLVTTAEDGTATPLVNSSNLNAINSALRTALVTADSVDTPQELEALISAYNAVLAAADAGADRPTDGTLSAAAQALTPEQFTALGVSGVTPALLSAVQAVVDAMASNRAESAANLQATVDAITKISLLADGRSATVAGNTPAAAVTAADITAAGVPLSNTTVASAVSSALDGLNFNQVNTPEKLQGLVNAYAKILAEANEAEPLPGAAYTLADTNPDATPDADPTAGDYQALGAALSGVTTGTADAENLRLLNDVLKRKAASQVDTVAEINAIGEAVQFVMDQVALASSTTTAVPSEADKQKWLDTFQALSLRGLDVGADGDPGNIQEVLNMLARQADDGSSVDTVAKIQALVDTINASLKVISDYALSNTNRVPTIDDYANAGIKNLGVNMVNEANLTAVNNAVDRLTDADVDTRAKIRSVVNAYNAILEFANGSAADSAAKPTEAQYRAIGVNLASAPIGLIKDEVTDPRIFSLFTDIIGAQQDAGVDSPAKIEALAATAGDIVRTAREVPGDAARAQLTLARLQAIGLFANLSGSADDSLNSSKVDAFRDAIRRSDDALIGTNRNNGTTVDSLPEVLAIANAVDKVLNHAADVPGAPVPTLTDYATLGVNVPVAATSTAANVLAVLNNAVKAAEPTAVDSVAELNALAATVDRLMQVAAGADPAALSPVLTVADLTRLGLNGVSTPSDLAAVLGKIGSTADDGSALTDPTALQVLVTAAVAAQAKIRNYAQNDGGDLPTVADFEAVGLTIPSSATATQAQYLTFIQTALASTQVTGVKADTPTELQAIIIAAQRVLSAANGVARDAEIPEGATSAVTRADLIALGLDPAKLSQDGTVNLLSGVIDASTADQVNTPALLEALLDLIAAVMAEAAGTGTKTDDELKAILGQLNAIPTDSEGNPRVDLVGNWPAIREAIKASKNDGTDIDTFEELQALIQRANDAQDTIRLYAAGTGVVVPTVNDYTAVGLVNTAADGSVTPLVTTENLAAINAALATVAVGADQASTPAQLRQVIAAYNRILDEANGPDVADANVSVNPTVADYTAIGSDVEGVTRGTANANVLSLLNSVVGNVNDAAVDTPAEINNLGVLVNKVMAQARNTDPNVALLTVADLVALGVDTLGESDGSPALLAALRVIRISADDGSAVNTLPKLNTMVRSAIAAYTKINAYADAIAPTDLPAPTAADFVALGLVVPASVTANGAAAIAASLLTPLVNSAQVNTPDKLQALLNAYDKVLKAADGTAGNTSAANAVTAAELALIGVVLGSTADGGADDAAKLALLHSALDAQTSASKVDSPAEIEALNATAAALIDSAISRAPAALTPEALVNLGLNLPAGLTQEQADAVASAVAAQGDASKVDSLIELNAIGAKALAAQAKIAAYAAAEPAPSTGTTVPTLQDYLDLGLVNADGSPSVTTTNLASVNSALASSGVTRDKADSPQEVKAIVAAYDKVLDVATPPTTGSAPNAADYAALGLNPAPADGSILQALLNGFLPVLGSAAALLPNLQAADTALDKIVNAANGTADLAPELTAADLAALGLTLPADSVLANRLAALVSAAADIKLPTGVDSVIEVQNLLSAAQRVMNSAAGLPVSPALSASDLAALGVDISGRTPAEQAAILGAVGTSADDGSEVDSLEEIRALVTKATAALTKVADFAAADPAPTTGAAVPTVSDYKDMGVAGVTDSNVAAINAALATTVVGRTQADEQPEVQAIADIYSRVLTAANEVRGDFVGTLPSATELQRLGVNLGSAVSGDAFSLLQTALDAVAQSQVDTPAEIAAIAASAARMVAAANASSPAGLSLTVDDFARLGVKGVEADNLAAAIDAVVVKASGADVNTAAKLQGVIDGLLRDLKLIRNYADAIVNTDSLLGDTGVVLVPTLANYIGAGVIGVGTGPDQVPVAVLNAAVEALTSIAVDSRSKLQAITSVYARVLSMADGTSGNTAVPVSSADLILIGVSPAKVPAEGSAALSLLQGALDVQPATRATVDTPAKIGALADIAAKVIAYAEDPASPPAAPAPSMAELQSLGLTGLSDTTVANALRTGVQGAIAAADPSGVDTLADLQQIVNAAAKARNLTLNGSPIIASRPNSAELTFDEFRVLGVSNVVNAATNIELLNDVIDGLTSYGLIDTPAELMALAAVVNKVMDVANDVPGATLTLAELQSLGLSTTEVTAASLSAAVAAIKARAPAAVDTLAELRTVVTAARDAQLKIQTYAQTVADDSAPTPGASPTMPTVADFTAMGVTGVSAANLAAVLAALASAAVDGVKAGSAPAVQSIVDSYAKILAMADATGGNTSADAAATASDYANIGLSASSVSLLADAARLALLNGAVDAQARTAVDAPSEIQALLNRVNTLMDHVQGLPGAVAPVLADFTALGVRGLSAAARANLLSEVLQGKGIDAVATTAKLQAVADAVAAVFTGAAGGTGPTQDQLALLGFTVDSSSTARIQAAIAATADDGGGVDTLAELRAVVANDAPTSADTTLSATEDTDRVMSLADFAFADAADLPANALLQVIITGLPGSGTLKLNGVDVTANQSISKADIEAGKLVFRASQDGNGNAYATVKFKVQDDGGTANGGADTSGEHTLTFNVAPVNDLPTGTVVPEVNSITVTGLTRADGATASLANGLYIRLLDAERSALLFGAGFDPAGTASLLDTSKPVYRYTDSSGADWYLWARQGSGYHLSKLNDTSEWFWELSTTAGSFADTPAGLKALGNRWVMSDAAAPIVSSVPGHVFAQNAADTVDWAVGGQVRADTSALVDPDGLGTLSYQWQISLDGATGWTDISGATSQTWTVPAGVMGRYVRVNISYTDLQGQAEVLTSAVTRLADAVPPVLDLDGASAGNDYFVSARNPGEAVTISNRVHVSDAGAISKIEVVANSAAVPLTSGEKITVVGRSFNLDGSSPAVTFEVSGVTWTASYDAVTGALTFSAAGAGAAAGSAQALIASMEYVNTEAPGSVRVLSVSVSDFSGNKSAPAVTRVSFDSAGPLVDMDSVAEGTGHTVTLSSVGSVNTGVLIAVSPTVSDASALTSVQIAVSGLRDGADELITIGASQIQADGSAVPTTVSDGTSTWTLAYRDGVFTFTQAAGRFTAAASQALLQSLGFKNTSLAPSDGARLFDFTLTDQHGNVSTPARSSVMINAAVPTAAVADALVTTDADGDGVKGDVFTVSFSELVDVSRVSDTARWTLSGGALLGTGASIEAVDPLTIDGVEYASSFRVRGGTGRTYTTGTTFTLQAADVVDSTGTQAAGSVVFTMTDIVAPRQVTPPLAIAVDNYINATETSVSVSYSFTSSTDNQRIRYYVNGIELSGKAQTLLGGQTSATLTMSLADWGGDGAKSISARLEDAAGNLGTVGISKSVIVDTSANTTFTALLETDAGAVGPTAGDVLTLNFAEAVVLTSLSAQFGSGATFVAVGGTPAPGTHAPFFSDVWRVTLGTSPSSSLAGSAVQIGVRDVAGNVATVSGNLPEALYDLPGEVYINSVTSDNVLTASELTQTVTLDLKSAKAGDTVKLYIDGRLAGTQVLDTAASTSSFDLTAADWGADGERVLTATIERGTTVVSSQFNRSVYVNADGAHWSMANGDNTAIWFDPDTLNLANGSRVSSWTASVGGSVATQTDPNRQPTLVAGSVNGHNQLFFDGGGNFTNPEAAGTDFLIFSDPNRITGTTRAERNVAMFAAAAAQNSTATSGVARVILNLGYFSGATAGLDARSGVFSLGTENNANSLAGTARSSTALFLGSELANTTSSGVYFTEAFRYAANTNTLTLLANDQKLSTTSTSTMFLNTSDANAGQGNPLLIGSANYGRHRADGGAGAWYGNVGDVIALVTPNAVTDNQMLEIQTYLAAKYRTSGTQVSLREDGRYDLSTSQTSSVLIDDLLTLTSRVSNDVITTAGSDYVNAGGGDDQVHIKDLSFRHLDGGLGHDTLSLASDYMGSSSIVLADFVSNARGNSGDAVADARVNAAGWHKLYGFEQIDLSTSSLKQTITIDAKDVNQLSETNTLHTKLGDNDVLNVTGFSSQSATWGHYVFNGQLYNQKFVDSSGAYTLYAVGGNSEPRVSAASYVGNVLTLNFNEALSSSAVLGDWSVSGGATSISSLSQSGATNNTLSFTLGSIAANSVVQLAYSGTALKDLDGKAIRFKNIWVGSGEGDNLNASANTDGIALFGNSGSDTLTGGAGSDLLVGGQGNDTLTGGLGADIFAFAKGELSQDTVTDFRLTDGDTLDLSALLQGAGMDKSSRTSVNNYLQLSQSGNDAVLRVSVTGSGDFAFADQTVTLTQAWASGGLNDDLMTLLNNRVFVV